jgi:hypothetical protein
MVGWCSWLSHLVNIVNSNTEKVLGSSPSLIIIFLTSESTRTSLGLNRIFGGFFGSSGSGEVHAKRGEVAGPTIYLGKQAG